VQANSVVLAAVSSSLVNKRAKPSRLSLSVLRCPMDGADSGLPKLAENSVGLIADAA
jgi:hypothetical protein